MIYNMCVYIDNTTYINGGTGILVCYLLCTQQLPAFGTLLKQAGNLTDSGDSPHFQGMLVKNTSLVF